MLHILGGDRSFDTSVDDHRRQLTAQTKGGLNLRQKPKALRAELERLIRGGIPKNGSPEQIALSQWAVMMAYRLNTRPALQKALVEVGVVVEVVRDQPIISIEHADQSVPTVIRLPREAGLSDDLLTPASIPPQRPGRKPPVGYALREA